MSTCYFHKLAWIRENEFVTEMNESFIVWYRFYCKHYAVYKYRTPQIIWKYRHCNENIALLAISLNIWIREKQKIVSLHTNKEWKELYSLINTSSPFNGMVFSSALRNGFWVCFRIKLLIGLICYRFLYESSIYYMCLDCMTDSQLFKSFKYLWNCGMNACSFHVRKISAPIQSYSSSKNKFKSM